jgi:hypothetical protein
LNSKKKRASLLSMKREMRTGKMSSQMQMRKTMSKRKILKKNLMKNLKRRRTLKDSVVSTTTEPV